MSEDKSFKQIEKFFFELLKLIKFIKWENRVKLFQLAEKHGFHILKTGVIVHFHDIFLPKIYPKKWLDEKLVFWNE